MVSAPTQCLFERWICWVYGAKKTSPAMYDIHSKRSFNGLKKQSGKQAQSSQVMSTSAAFIYRLIQAPSKGGWGRRKHAPPNARISEGEAMQQYQESGTSKTAHCKVGLTRNRKLRGLLWTNMWNRVICPNLTNFQHCKGSLSAESIRVSHT